ncbi:MAG: 50S ribosomal protein L16 [Candidatus Paceibacterota bacterium]|jgi:large subunit ribosomal protein L16
MLLPKKVQHRKWQKGVFKGKATRGNTVDFGQYGLKALEIKRITSRQIEASRRTITRQFKKEGKIWIRIFPDKPITSKGAEVPMGAGKGDVSHFVAMVKPGTIIFEVGGVSEKLAREALIQAAYKLPVRTKFVKAYS